MRNKILIYIVTLISSFSFGQEDEWQFMGLGSEEVTAIAINYDNDSIVYAGTMSNFSAGSYGSIYKSIDAGATWDTLLYGLSCVDITIHPQNPDVLFASLGGANFTQPGVLKFDSEGDYEWMSNGIYLDWETGVATIEIDPDHPDTMYAGTGGFFGGYLYKTINGGEEWNVIGAPDTENPIEGMGGKLTVAINPENTQELYVAGNMNSDIYKSIDGGENWFCSFCENPMHMFLDLELDNTNPDILYAPLPGDGLYKSVDAGDTWFKIEYEPDSIFRYINYLEISPENNEELYLSTGGYGIYRSHDGGNGWAEWSEGYNYTDPDLYIRSLSISPTGNTIYCGIEFGIYKRVIGSQNNIDPNDTPFTFSLKPNFPNPFNGSTIIPFILNKSGKVEISIIDIKGRYVKKIVNQYHDAGEYSVKWDGTDIYNKSVPSGIYFYKIKTNKISKTGKMILMK